MSRQARLDRIAAVAARQAPPDTVFSTLTAAGFTEDRRPRYRQHWRDREEIHAGDVGETHDAMCDRLWPGCATFVIVNAFGGDSEGGIETATPAA